MDKPSDGFDDMNNSINGNHHLLKYNMPDTLHKLSHLIILQKPTREGIFLSPFCQWSLLKA